MQSTEIAQDQDSTSIKKNLVSSILSIEETLKGDGDIFLIVSIKRGDSLALGNTIIETDRELRRTISIHEEGGFSIEGIVEELTSHSTAVAVQTLPPPDRASEDLGVSYNSFRDSSRGRSTRPADISRGATHLVAFEPGSGHLLFDVTGAVLGVLTASPLSAMLNLSSLIQGGRWIGARILVFRKQKATLEPRQLLKASAANGGNLQSVLGPPSHTVDIGDVIEASRISTRYSLVTESMNKAGTGKERTALTIETFS